MRLCQPKRAELVPVGTELVPIEQKWIFSYLAGHKPKIRMGRIPGEELLEYAISCPVANSSVRASFSIDLFCERISVENGQRASADHRSGNWAQSRGIDGDR